MNKICFNLNYQTKFGEQIGIKLNINNEGSIIYLDYLSNGNWFLQTKINVTEFSYIYFFQDLKGNKIFEWNEKKINLSEIKNKEIELFDYFSKANFPENYFNTKPFEISRQNNEYQTFNIQKNTTHIFTISAPVFNKDHEIRLLGNIDLLGNWDPKKSVKMLETSFGIWKIDLNFTKQLNYLNYKYAIFDKNTNELISFENGENRNFNINIDSKNKISFINDVYFKYPKDKLWKKTGVAIPIFSLKTNESFGVGEFLDLKKFGEFANKSSLKLIQILPINDTTANYSWTDSYPYSTISVYALHPIYLNIENIEYKLTKTDQNLYKKLQKELNNQEFVDYENVIKHKWNFINKIVSKNIESIQKDKKFKEYIQNNQHWIYAYSVFCVLRDENKTPDFSTWKTNSVYSEKEIKSFFNKNHNNYKTVLTHSFVQYQLHIQLIESINYLHKLGISLKGDLPIGIYRNSVEAWAEPEYFGIDFQAGAPPDNFAILGQNWEFPTYNWERMQQDNYSWWQNRFQNMSQYFDAFRIDHILGFFRIWRIPMHATQGILGYFHPAIPFSKEELLQREINFDYQELTKPFITLELIQKYFKDDFQTAKELLFYEKNEKLYFKENYNSQRKIQNLSENNIWINKFKEEILTLLANVILLEEEINGEIFYHPRFYLYTTDYYSSFSNDQKKNLYDLYIHYFFERQENIWLEKGLEKLPFLKKTTNMLTCGEDLGLVPKCVPKVMNDLAILALQVQRMPSGNEDFSDPKDAPYLNVVTTSSHDTSTLRQWWEENKELTQKYYNQQLNQEFNAPDKLTPEIMLIILRQHLYSDSMLTIFPLQDLFALHYQLYVKNIDSERINIPSIFPHFWKYRMHLSIEELLKHNELIDLLNLEIKNSGRN